MYLETKMKQFEQTHNATVIYLVTSGSKLYGTDTQKSDTDYKGIFIPSLNSVLLKQDIEHWKTDTNEKLQNNSEDIDLQLVSIHHFFDKLQKGETGALDLLFSMWSDSVVYQNQVFIDVIKANYKSFLNRNLHSFIGYAVSQASKYGMKGTRYKELNDFSVFLDSLVFNKKLKDSFPEFIQYISLNKPKYIKFIEAPGPKTGTGDITYIHILGKLYSGDIVPQYFKASIKTMMEKAGNRTKSASKGTDWKALSHAVRVIYQVEELLDTHFIKFPLKDKEYLTSIKQGEIDVNEVLDHINIKLDVVKLKMEKSKLPKNSDKELINDIKLSFYKDMKLSLFK